MKKIIFLIFFLILLTKITIGNGLIRCPAKTTANYRLITFVGKVGLGGDKKVKVWFEYGNSKDDLNFKTKALTFDKEAIFCIRENKNIVPCKTYYYRAVAQNSSGVNYGEIKNIRTLCINNNLNKNIPNSNSKLQK